MIQYINLQLASIGQPLYYDACDADTKYSNTKFLSLTEGLINSFKEKSRLLSDHLSPADTRIQNFLNSYLSDVDFDNSEYRLPNKTFVLNQIGLAREVSLPPDAKEFKSELEETVMIHER